MKAARKTIVPGLALVLASGLGACRQRRPTAGLRDAESPEAAPACVFDAPIAADGYTAFVAADPGLVTRTILDFFTAGRIDAANLGRVAQDPTLPPVACHMSGEMAARCAP